MIISKINMLNYNKKISFGESEGCAYSDTDLSPKIDYELKKKQINAKYDLYRKQWINNSDCSEVSAEVFWSQLHKIEALRQRELDKLAAECVRSISKK